MHLDSISRNVHPPASAAVQRTGLFHRAAARTGALSLTEREISPEPSCRSSSRVRLGERSRGHLGRGQQGALAGLFWRQPIKFPTPPCMPPRRVEAFPSFRLLPAELMGEMVEAILSKVRTRLPAGGGGPPTNDQAKKSGAVTPSCSASKAKGSTVLARSRTLAPAPPMSPHSRRHP
jgi:hypothetical protein